VLRQVPGWRDEKFGFEISIGEFSSTRLPALRRVATNSPAL
jgi:hypothetical protein